MNKYTIPLLVSIAVLFLWSYVKFPENINISVAKSKIDEMIVEHHNIKNVNLEQPKIKEMHVGNPFNTDVYIEPPPVKWPNVARPLIEVGYIKASLIPSTCPKYEYPKESKQANEQGVIFLQLHVMLNGQAIEAKVEKSSGFEKLDSEAIKVLMMCTFKPATQNGKSIVSWYPIRFTWKIGDYPNKL